MVEESSTLTLFTGGLFKCRRCFFTSNLCLLTDAPEAHDSQTSTRRSLNILRPSPGRAMPLTDEDPQGQRDHPCPVVPLKLTCQAFSSTLESGASTSSLMLGSSLSEQSKNDRILSHRSEGLERAKIQQKQLKMSLGRSFRKGLKRQRRVGRGGDKREERQGLLSSWERPDSSPTHGS